MARSFEAAAGAFLVTRTDIPLTRIAKSLRRILIYIARIPIYVTAGCTSFKDTLLTSGGGLEINRNA